MIEIKEYMGWNNKDVQIKESAINVLENIPAYKSNDPICENSLMVDVEGIHVGLTRNYTYYTENALKSSIHSWTKPYAKPVIMHHNEKDGRIIGRVKSVVFKAEKTRSGTPALVFTINVPDKEGKEQILDGRLSTTSIGIIAKKVNCSICSQDICADGECEHERGTVYDGNLCYWIIDEMEAKELSYVIVPSDKYAHNIKIYYASTNKEIKESQGEVEKMEDLKQGIDKKEDIEIKPTGEIIIENPKEEPKIEEPLKEEDTKIDEPKIEDTKTEDQKDEDLKLLEDTIQELKVVIAELRAQLTTKTSELEKEIGLRESIETKLIKFEMQEKEELVQKVISLRESANKPLIEKDILLSRTKESLIDAVSDLTEEVNTNKKLEVEGNKEDLSQIQESTNPTLIKDKEKNEVDVKEEKKASNIDVAEAFEEFLGKLGGREIANKK